MSPELFNVLVEKIRCDIEKRDTRFRERMSPQERLALTLQFLGQGDSMRMLSITYRMGYSTVCEIIHETTRVIWNKLKDQYLPSPNQETLRDAAKEFEELWRFCDL